MSEVTEQGCLKIYKALFEFQKLVPEIEKNCIAKAGTFSYKYADLPDIKRAIKPALDQCKLTITHSSIEKNNEEYLVTKVVEIESGSFIQSVTKVPPNLEPQKKGAWFTYFRRYHICNLLDIAADEDVDGIHKENVIITKQGATNERYNDASKKPVQQHTQSNGSSQGTKPNIKKENAATQTNNPGAVLDQGTSGQNNQALKLDELAEYKVKIKGKYLDQSLEEIGVTNLENYKGWWQKQILEKKPVGKEVSEFIELATMYIHTKKLKETMKGTLS